MSPTGAVIVRKRAAVVAGEISASQQPRYVTQAVNVMTQRDPASLRARQYYARPCNAPQSHTALGAVLAVLACVAWLKVSRHFLYTAEASQTCEWITVWALQLCIHLPSHCQPSLYALLFRRTGPQYSPKNSYIPSGHVSLSHCHDLES